METESTSKQNTDGISREEYEKLVGTLQDQNKELQRQLDWFKH